MFEKDLDIKGNLQDVNTSSKITSTDAGLTTTVKKPNIAMCIFRVIFGPAFLFGILFGCAGTLNWYSGWVFIAVNVPFIIISVPLMYKYNPEMLIRKFPKDTKKFDKIFMAFYLPLFHIIMIIGGLDERFDLSGNFATGVVISSCIVYGIAFGFWLWAVIANKNFELTVRIQHDRGHKVCSSGPYKIVRHPAYIAGVLMFLSMPFALSTFWGLIPAVFLVIALVIRTYLEDKTLINELDGYDEFTHKTKYRLIPYLW